MIIFRVCLQGFDFMQETTAFVQTCKCVYECEYLHINVSSSLFSYLKNLSQPWKRNKTITVASGTCLTGAHQRTQAKLMRVPPCRRLSLPSVWLLLSRLRRFSSCLHFQVCMICSRGSTKYTEGFFAEFCANTLVFFQNLSFRFKATLKLFFAWLEGQMAHY